MKGCKKRSGIESFRSCGGNCEGDSPRTQRSPRPKGRLLQVGRTQVSTESCNVGAEAAGLLKFFDGASGISALRQGGGRDEICFVGFGPSIAGAYNVITCLEKPPPGGVPGVATNAVKSRRRKKRVLKGGRRWAGGSNATFH